MSRSSLQDPLKNFRFKVIIPGGAGEETVAGFKEVTGLVQFLLGFQLRGPFS